MPRGVYVRTAEYREKISQAGKGHLVSMETRAKIGASNSKRLKGRKLSDSHRARMSKARKELWAKRKADPEFMAQHREKLSKALKGRFTGELASNWHGGTNQNERTDNRKFAWRDAILLRDNYTCQICDQYGGDMHIDHIKSWSEYPELRFELSNGRALCRPCHYWITFRRKMPKGSKWGLVGLKDLA